MKNALRNVTVGLVGISSALCLSAAAEAEEPAALFFDGIDDYIEVPDSPSLDITGPITIEVWINFTDYPNCCWNVVVAKTWSHPSTNSSYGISFSNHPTGPNPDTLFGNFSVLDDLSDDGYVLTKATAIRDGAWHHIAIVYDIDVSETRLFVDGVLADQSVKVYPIRLTDFSVYIANAPGFDRRTFRGFIDEIRIWNVARTQTEIEGDRFRELTGEETGLAAYWKLNEMGGTAIYDASPNGNTGFFRGNPSWVKGGAPLSPLPLGVAIDVKPGSTTNSINLASAGVVPVGIMGSETFDVSTVDPETVSLAGASVKLVGKGSKYLCQEEYLNDDDFVDLLCKIETEQLLINEGESIVVLEARQFDGKSIRGEDNIRIVP